MFRLILACCLALLAAALTLLFAYLGKVTVATMATRTVLSLGIFGLIGYFMGFYFERNFANVIIELNDKGKHVDIASRDENEDLNKLVFNSFTSEEYENLAAKKTH